MSQQSLVHEPGHSGLWNRYVVDGEIDHAAWLRACAHSEFVGNCRSCGDYLIPERPIERGGGRFDYTAACRQDRECRYELTAPGGRVLRRSSRLSERPKGA